MESSHNRLKILCVIHIKVIIVMFVLMERRVNTPGQMK